MDSELKDMRKQSGELFSKIERVSKLLERRDKQLVKRGLVHPRREPKSNDIGVVTNTNFENFLERTPLLCKDPLYRRLDELKSGYRQAQHHLALRYRRYVIENTPQMSGDMIFSGA